MHEQFWQLERAGKYVTVRLEHDPVAGYVDIRAAGLRANVRTVDHPDGTTSFDFNVLGEPLSILLRQVNGHSIYIFHDPQAETQPVAAPVSRPMPALGGGSSSRTSGSSPSVRAPSSSYASLSAMKAPSSFSARPPRGPGPGYIADPDSAPAESPLAPYGTPTTYGEVTAPPVAAATLGAAASPYAMPPGLGASGSVPPAEPVADPAWPATPDRQPGVLPAAEYSEAGQLPASAFDGPPAERGYDTQDVWIEPPEPVQKGAPVSTNVVVMVSAVAALVMFGVGISYLSKNVRNMATIEWKSFSPAMGGYAIDFPGPVTETKESIKTPSGYMILHTAETSRLVQGQRVTFTVTYGDLPESSSISTEAALAGSRKGVLEQTKGTLASNADITLAGYPGNEFTVTSADGLRHQRVYMVSRRLYELVTNFDGDGTPKATPKGFEPPDEHFFRTFSLVDDDHPAPAAPVAVDTAAAAGADTVPPSAPPTAAQR